MVPRVPAGGEGSTCVRRRRREVCTARMLGVCRTGGAGVWQVVAAVVGRRDGCATGVQGK